MEETKIATAEKQSNDFWQAEVLGQIYDTDFAEMAQWISDGALMKTDKVKRGNLRWIEAGKVPTLLPFFNAKESGIEPPQVQTNYTNGNNQAHQNSSETENFAPPSAEHFKLSMKISKMEIFQKKFNNSFQEPEFEQPLANFCILA